MNEIELQEVLRKNIGAKFVGVFPRDILPQPIDGAYVINTDPHYKPGQHWVAMYLNGGRGEYYDSLGLPPKNSWTFYQRSGRLTAERCRMLFLNIADITVYTICVID